MPTRLGTADLSALRLGTALVTAAYVGAAPVWSTGPAYLARDTFTRADGPLGTADVGGAWAASAGTFGVSGGAAVCTANGTGGFAVAALNAGAADAVTSAVFTSSAAASAVEGIAFRVVDGANLWIAIFHVGGIKAFSITAGVFAQAASAVYARTNGVPVTLAASVTGTTARVLANGVEVLAPFTVAAHAAATRFGFYSETPTAAHRADDLAVLAP